MNLTTSSNKKRIQHSGLCDNFKQSITHVAGVPMIEEKEGKIKKYFKIKMTKIFQNLIKEK